MQVDNTRGIPALTTVPLSAGALNLTPPAIETPAPKFDELVSFASASAAKQTATLKGLALTKPIAYTPNDVAKRYNDPYLGYTAFNPTIEETYYNQMSAGEIFGRNVGQSWRRGLATFIGGFSDFPDTFEAIGSGATALAQGKDLNQAYNESMTAFTNTSWKNALADWAENYSNLEPIYQSASTPQGSLAAYFNPYDFKTFAGKWGGFVNNLGFTVGAIANAVVTDAAIGLVTGGTGEAFLLPKQASTISRSIWNLGKTLTKPKAWEELSTAFKKTSSILDNITQIGTRKNITDGFRFGLSLYNSAVGEGSIEGYNAMKQLETELVDDYTRKYGAAPTTADLTKIKETAQKTGNAVTIANTALLMATNYVTFGKILNPSSAVLNSARRQAIKKGVTRATGNLDDVMVAAANPAQKWYTKVWNGLGKAKEFGLQVGNESFEEGAQFTISEAATDYYTAKYRGSDDAEQFWKSMSKGLTDTLTTGEGLENVIMGGLSGGVFYGGGKMFEYAQRKRKGLPDNIKSAVDAANSTAGLTGSISSLHSEFATQTERVKQYEKAVASGNVEAAKDLKTDLFFSWIHSASKNGLFDLRMEALEDLKNISDEQFASFWGIDFSESNAKTAKNYVELLKKKALRYKEVSDKIEVTFGNNPFSPKKDGIKHQAFEDYKEALAHSLVTIDDSEARIKDLQEEVNKLLPTADVNNLVKLTNREGLTDIREQLSAKIANLKIAEENAKTEPTLKKPITNEIEFLTQQVTALDTLLEGQNSTPELFKDTVKNLLRYFNDPITGQIKLIGENTELDETFARLNAISHLRSRAITAIDTYNALIGKNGFDSVLATIQPIINGKFAKRLRVQDGKYVVLTPEQMAQEQLEKINAELNAKAVDDEAEINKQIEAIAPLEATEEVSPEEVQIIDSIIDKEENGEELTPEEEQVLAEKPKAVERKKVEKKVREEYKQKAEEAAKSEDESKDVDDTGNPTGETKQETQAELPAEETTLGPEIEQVNRDSTAIDNLFGNLLYYTGTEADEKAFEAFRKVKADVEMPSKKFISNIYTQYILKSPIFKFIFGEKMKVRDVRVELKASKEGPIREPVKIAGSLYRDRNPKIQATLFINNKAVGNISDTATLLVKKGDIFVPLSKAIQTMTLKEYKDITGFKEETFDEFRTKFDSYHEMAKSVFGKYQVTKAEEAEELKLKKFQADQIMASAVPYNTKIKRLIQLEFLTNITMNGKTVDTVYYQGRLIHFMNIDGKTIPIYRSSNGTSGKNQGGWYPFFGFGDLFEGTVFIDLNNPASGTKETGEIRGGWLIKGTDKTSKDFLNYSKGHGVAKIQYMQQLMNRHVTFSVPAFSGPEAFKKIGISSLPQNEAEITDKNRGVLEFNKAVFGKENLGVYTEDALNANNNRKYSAPDRLVGDIKETVGPREWIEQQVNDAKARETSDTIDPNKVVTIPKEVVSQLIAVIPTVLNAKYSYTAKDSTLLKDIQALGDNSYIISVKKVFSKTVGGEFTESKVINIIGENGVLSEDEIANDTALSDYLSNKANVKAILDNNSRYALLNRMPNGKFSSFSRVVARPVEFKSYNVDALFEALKTDNLGRIAHFINNVYIADSTRPKGSKVKIELTTAVDGSMSIVATEDRSRLLAAVDITDEMLDEAESMDDLLQDINAEILNQMGANPLVLTRDSFKVLIEDDAKATFKDFGSKLSVSTTPYYWNDIRLTVVPRNSVNRINADPVTDAQYNEFLNGNLPEEVRDNIVNKKVNNMDLSKRESEIFDAYTDEINNIILTQTQGGPVKNSAENLAVSQKIRIFAVEYDPNDIEGIARAKALEKQFVTIVRQLRDNKTIQEIKCK